MELLRDLSRRLSEMADAPVSAHPQALDEVHQDIVAELDAISRLGGGPTAAPPALDSG